MKKIMWVVGWIVLVIIVMILIIVLPGCKDYESGLMMHFDIPDLELEEYTVRSVLKYVGKRIQYVSDDIHDVPEYWQSPDQTWTWQCGDCEDITILTMYLVYRDLGIEPLFVVGRLFEHDIDIGKHAWIRINGVDWEPQNGMTCEEYESRTPCEYQAWSTISYAEVIYRSVNGHKRLTVN